MELKKFRDAVNKGKKIMAKNSAKLKEYDAVFKLVDDTGKVNELPIKVNLKKLSGKDIEDYHAIQWDYDDPDNPKKLCSRYTAATIVGCVDEKGERVFTVDDIDFLEDQANAAETIKITSSIFEISELNQDVREAKKPN